AASGEDSVEQLARARVEDLWRRADGAVEFDANAISAIGFVDDCPECVAKTRFVFGDARADIHAANRKVGDDVERSAAGDFADVDDHPAHLAVEGVQLDDDLAKAGDGVSTLLEIPSGMGGAAVDDEREVARSLARIDQISFTNRRLENQADAMARRGLGE